MALRSVRNATCTTQTQAKSSRCNLQSFISVVHRQQRPLRNVVAPDGVGETAAHTRADDSVYEWNGEEKQRSRGCPHRWRCLQLSAAQHSSGASSLADAWRCLALPFAPICCYRLPSWGGGRQKPRDFRETSESERHPLGHGCKTKEQLKKIHPPPEEIAIKQTQRSYQ